MSAKWGEPISCHGEHGDGRGYSAQWFDPRPRDFTRAIFKCRSTPSGTLPVDDDLVRDAVVRPSVIGNGRAPVS